MKEVLEILKRELRNVSKDSSLFLILLLAPILYAFMYGSIYLNKGEEKVKLALIDNDGTAISRTLTQQLNSTPMIEIVPSSNISEAQEMMFQGEVQGYFYIQSGFEKNIFSLKQANVNLVLNASRFLPSSDLLSTATKVCLTVGAGVRKTYFNKQGMGEDEAMKMTNPINMDYRPLYNSSMTYGSFLLPGLLAIILQQTLLIGVAAAFTSEREEKKLLNLYQISKQSISKMIFGKSLLYFVVFMIFGFFFSMVNFSVFDVEVRGNYLDLAVISALFIATIIVFGMLIGSFFKTKLFAFQVLVFSSYPIFLITGYSMPYQALPKFVQILSDMLPTSPFLKTYISIVQAGGSLSDNLGSVIHLVVLWIVFELLLILRIKYLVKI
ncbi:ABC transporter permease [Chryseobacterium balustinum]|uniref:ABC-2 type transport system permease protein n=1 Tax=Chryseobacterium balustinum TaxID=246 RepID=A0AAX2IR36_9FLAO|nr:ABC transporter permease [Chryseobacterium balustinum]AZB29452.1 ABC transporter permease [Chryseobacterium balustinum]SKB75013.1 ABC-2 type transport system permease protein [Chryseobacterium balustinum]SQA92131.1 Inner membrane transport permease ybhS [Chryseobacterium balustinum]